MAKNDNYNRNQKPQNTGGRIPPHDLEAEKAVLGSIMLRPKAIYDIVDVVGPETFYSQKHRLIFQAMLALNSKNEPIDLLSVSSQLKAAGNLESVGGRTYLNDLTTSVPMSANITHYASLVQKSSVLRGLIDSAEHISSLAFDKADKTLEELMDEAEKKIFAITHMPRSGKFVSLKHSLSETWDQIEKLQEAGEGLRGVPTGFSALDNMLSGLQKSDLVILAARPSVGKTTFALDIARNAAVDHNVPVGIFSLEMSAGQLTQRLLSSHSKVSSWKLRTGRLSTDKEFTQIRDSLDALSKAPIYIDDQAGNSIIKMKSVARRLKSEHGLGLIVVDYLQLMTAGRNYDSMVNQVTEISRSLKELARELDVPVLALSQLSRAVESRGGKPRLSDLRDSGSIEQDADVVMFIHREDRTGNRAENETDGIAEILIEKHRNGPVGKVDLFFDEKTTSFLSIDKNHDSYVPQASSQDFDDF
jgi:replicative DNA helicase